MHVETSDTTEQPSKDESDKSISSEKDEVAREPKKSDARTEQCEVVKSKQEIPKVIIPFVLPWESKPCLQNQHGMTAFGSCRNAVTKAIDTGGEPIAHHNDPFLSMFAMTNNLASQKGMHSFGGHRQNVSKSVRTGDVPHEKAKNSETVIPKQAGGFYGKQNRLTAPIGSLRRNVMKIEYQDKLINPKMDPQSNTFLTRSAAPNPNSHAGSSAMDHFRSQVIKLDNNDGLAHDRKTESMLPRWYDRGGLVSPAGTGAGIAGMGHPRQIITPVKDIYPLLEEDIINSKKIIPWATAPSLQSQQGTGGFQKRRDVTIGSSGS
ncbi:hypothetical protein TTRE_0000769801 [Trichuris trichiura]|uniref:Uncharacterized protein n=1 Tax=Trichuris trichiura TaxID=36087 RepID=A0A077ZL71_TRITR|nr:hypothetical protein TTRE_0000769801 [Trichuris trichiura]